MGVGGQRRPLYLGAETHNLCIGGWAGPKTLPNRCGKLSPYRDLIPVLQARSDSLYQLRYLNFDVLLTVHLSIILVINQLNTKIIVL